MEYKAIYLDGLGYLLEIVHSKWWLVVPIFRVAQGSVLGPMLFLLCISDNRTNINGQLCFYAVDCLIYQLIGSPADHQILQNDLDTLTTRSRTWQIVNVRYFMFCPLY